MRQSAVPYLARVAKEGLTLALGAAAGQRRAAILSDWILFSLACCCFDEHKKCKEKCAFRGSEQPGCLCTPERVACSAVLSRGAGRSLRIYSAQCLPSHECCRIV